MTEVEHFLNNIDKNFEENKKDSSLQSVFPIFNNKDQMYKFLWQLLDAFF